MCQSSVNDPNQVCTKVEIVWTALNVPVICDLTPYRMLDKGSHCYVSLTETTEEVSTPAFSGRYQMKHSCTVF